MGDSNPLRGTDWDPLLRPEFEKLYWAKLQEFLKEERSRYRVFPPVDEVFTALRLTSYAKTKAVILGQDPYHGEGEAHGLCFSVRPGVPIRPSLRKILRELEGDGFVVRVNHGSLEPWARRGVLMLNAVLTVREGDPGSHWGRGWEEFTDAVIRVVAEKTPPAVFMLWGGKAQEKVTSALVDTPPEMIIESPHPMARPPASFLGSKPFSRANRALGKEDEIAWSLDDSVGET